MHERAAGHRDEPRGGVDPLHDPADVLGGLRHAVELQQRSRRAVDAVHVRPLPGHHALWHAGRAARVEHRDVLARARLSGLGGVGIEQLGVADRALEVRVVVSHLDEQAKLRQPVTHSPDAVCERAVEHEHLGVAVLEQVRELVIEVAVVDVHRNRAMLVGAVLRDEVLGAVVQVDGDLAIGTDACVADRGCESRSLVVPLPEGQPTIPLDERVDVWQLVGDDLPCGCDVDLHGASLLSLRESISRRPARARSTST